MLDRFFYKHLVLPLVLANRQNIDDCTNESKSNTQPNETKSQQWI